MSAQLKTEDPLWWVNFYTNVWATWVNTDRLPVLGYPNESIESRNVLYDTRHSTNPNRWGAKGKTSKSARLLLPDWKIELAMDDVIRDLNPEFRKVIYAHHEIRLKADELIACRIPIREMHLFGRDGRYSWPKKRLERMEVINTPQRTFYRTLDGARHAIMGHKKYRIWGY